MENCPTCKAALKGKTVCRRCKTDLTMAMAAARSAERHFSNATRAHGEGRWEQMLYHAQCAFSLRRTHANARMLACAALLNGNHRLALTCWAAVSRLPAEMSDQPSTVSPDFPEN